MSLIKTVERTFDRYDQGIQQLGERAEASPAAETPDHRLPVRYQRPHLRRAFTEFFPAAFFLRRVLLTLYAVLRHDGFTNCPVHPPPP